jgi:hypothetical protein
MRYLLLLVLFFAGSGPSFGQTAIDDLHISRDGEVVNIRVSVRNTGAVAQSGPLRIELFARPLGAPDWQPLFLWTDLGGLAAGHRVSRDFFSTDGDLASGLAAQGMFEVRADLSGPNLSQTVNKVAEHDPDHHH